MDRIVCRDRRSCVSAGDKRGHRLRHKPGRRAGGRGRAGRRPLRGSLTWLQVFLLELRQPFGACPQDGDAEGAGGRENTGSASRVCLKRVACVPAPRHVIVGGRDDTSCSGEAGPNTCADLGHGGDRPSPQLPRTDRRLPGCTPFSSGVPRGASEGGALTRQCHRSGGPGSWGEPGLHVVPSAAARASNRLTFL